MPFLVIGGALMATARDIMNPKVELIDRNATVAQVLTKMNERRVSSLMVDKSNPRDTYGIITMGDIVREVVSRGQALSEILAKDIMTKPVIVLMPELSVKHVARLFSNNHIARAPVIENGEVIGIITYHDILSDINLIDKLV